jgi:ABC-type transporter Mla subunit MlaD
VGLTASFDWSIVIDVGVGVGVLLMGIGIFVAMLALAKTLGRVNGTLDEVDKQIAGLGTPVGETLAHVEGIVGTADAALTHLGGAVRSLEEAAGSASHAAQLTKDAISPAIVNVGATLTGVTAGLRRLVMGKNSHSRTGQE